MLITGLLLIAANLRPSLTGVGPLLGQLGLSPMTAGIVTTLPLLAFAAASPLTPSLTRRLGLERALLGALLLLAAGIALRSELLFTGTALIGIGIAIGNVLLPSLVKRDFPTAVGTMTGAYATVMGLVAAIASGVAVPSSEFFSGGWHTALGVWLLPALVAIAVWLPRALRPRSIDAVDRGSVRLPWRSWRAWMVTLFMGAQSLGFYVMITWLPSVLHTDGFDPATGGWLLFLMQAVSVSTSLGVPLLIARLRDQRALAAGASTSSLLGYLGLWLLPRWAPLWAVVIGIGVGACLVLALTFLSIRAADAPTAGALSGMAQSIGYLLAAAGPVLFGALHAASGSWNLPLALLCVAALVQAAIGTVAGTGIVTGQRHG